MFSGNQVRKIFLGGKRDPHDTKAFHKITLIAFFAWVGLGSDGLSSSCYGPAEVMLALGKYAHLNLFIALATVITIVIVSTSYSQIIELFPTGGGGYLVSSKLLSPYVGMVSGCALLIDYILTITVSISSGSDALFSFLPIEYQKFKLPFSASVLAILTVLNMRGVKESILPLVPIFLIFVGSHLFIILYAVFSNVYNIGTVTTSTLTEFHRTTNEIGIAGTLFILVHAYSMGAGTYTGIEAVANGLPILREPKVQTAKRTMRYMAISLSFTAFGLMLAYLLFNVSHQPGKTLNAVLFDTATSGWNPTFAFSFVIITLISEAAILFVAAQTGFIDGPRVLSNMALDRWVPSKFASLSDRLVTQNGILLMGVAALILMVASGGSVTLLLVLYSINVFIDFTLSQTGMVKHWIQERKTEPKWKKKIAVNGTGLLMTFTILVSVIVVKFNEGGWITILITGGVISIVFMIKKHYIKTGKLIKKFDEQLLEIDTFETAATADSDKIPEYNPTSKTAVLLVNGFSGIGIHSLLSIFRLFGDTFHNYVFIEIGLIDAGVFKGASDLENLKDKVNDDVGKYINFMNRRGRYAEGFTATGLDIVTETLNLVPKVLERFPKSIFFGGQLVFPKDSLLTRMLHNYTVFSVQRQLYQKGIQFVILPMKL